ncbi:transcriptional regulator NrdR [Candidatus Pacearchaeota archaeon ex4484_71]|nr:MAG: transcriptional regulator NrdR [Candidatus Pacearchaeota archaeon ex4484_71]
MNCPFCGHPKSRVTDKRNSPDGIRRRRECLKCKKRFTTYEKIERGEMYIIKKDGRREKFDMNKLRTGVEKAFEKRPVSVELVQKMLREIEEQIRKKGKKEISTSIIGNLVSKKIKRIDKVAYIRFASVYKDFEDVDDFKEVIEKI